MPTPPFSRPVTQLAKERVSCRTFQPGGLESRLIGRLLDTQKNVAPPFGTPMRAAVIDQEQVRAGNLFSQGTYGLISGTRHFLTAPMPTLSPHRDEDLGFFLETAVLTLTDWQIGTCWIGGVFDRKRFGAQIGLGEGESLPAVIAFGKPAGKRSLRDRLVRWSARGDRRKPGAELFFAGAFGVPLPLADGDPFGPVLECLRLAPSASNKQPWRVIRLREQFHFFLARDPIYQKLSPHVDLQRIDLGIAMAHFELAAREAGLPGGWLPGPPPAISLPRSTEFIATWG